MRRKMGALLGLSAVLAIGATALAKAPSTKIHVGNLILTFGGTVSPQKLPRNDYVPVTTNVFGKIQTDDGTHPSALREAVVDVDKDVKINARGLPSCKAGQLEAQPTGAAKKVCGKTIVGSGNAHVEIAFPEQPPIRIASPLTVFNGGERGGKVKLLFHVFITVPVPAAIVTQVTIQRKSSGVHSIATVPVIAGGSGSTLDFKFKLGRTYSYKGKKVGYFEARCPDGKFRVTTPKTIFKNEAKVADVASTTILEGGLLVPCTPKG
jgi:hypothetical protein